MKTIYNKTELNIKELNNMINDLKRVHDDIMDIDYEREYIKIDIASTLYDMKKLMNNLKEIANIIKKNV